MPGSAGKSSPAAIAGADGPSAATASASDVSAAKFDVQLTLTERADGIDAAFTYATALFDAATGQRLSPLNQESALAIVRSRIDTEAPVASAELVTTASPEYRGALPAWRIAFDEPSKLAVYVGANNGLVTARRSELWRVYDFLWALHIMDYREHENFNHAPIIIVSILAFLSTIAGIALIPYRFKWRRRRSATPTG